MKTGKRKSRIGSVLANLVGKTLLVVAAFALVGAGTAQAALVDRFGGWSKIGDPGNANDSGGTGQGRVNYTYSIAKYEVSDDDYSDVMTGSGSGTYTPQTHISLYDAMEFANKLTEDEHGGSSDYNLYDLTDSDDDGELDSVTITKTRTEVVSSGELVYAIPTEDEWYKAAYGDPNGDGVFDDYSTYANADAETPPPEGRPDADPAVDGWNYEPDDGGSSIGAQDVGFSPEEQNGTHDMMGNVWEWQEDDTGDGLVRGGGFADTSANLRSSQNTSGYYDATVNSRFVGFRVVAIPEPASLGLFGIVCAALWFVRRKFRDIQS